MYTCTHTRKHIHKKKVLSNICIQNKDESLPSVRHDNITAIYFLLLKLIWLNKTYTCSRGSLLGMKNQSDN